MSQKQKLRIRWLALIGLLMALLAADFWGPKQAHFAWEAAPGFLAGCGFVSGAALILAAGLMRLFIQKDEKYYDQ